MLILKKCFRIFTSDKGGCKCVCPRSFDCLSVCLSVSLLARLLKNACMDLDEMLRVDKTYVGTWTNWLTFEPNPDYSPDAGTRLLSSISYVLQHGILLRWKNPTYSYWAPITAAMRGFKMVLFTASRGNKFVRSTCAPSSALLVAKYHQPTY